MSTAESSTVIELCNAFTRGDIESVKRLIEGGASPLVRDDQGNTLFHLCCNSVQCGLQVLEYLISVSDIVDCGSLVNNESSTLLHLVCSSGKLDFVRFLFTQHQNSFELCQDMHGHTPLYYACKHRHVEIVKYLYDEEIELSFDDIYQCVKVSDWKITKLLLQKITFKEFMIRVIHDDLVDLGRLVTKEKVVRWMDKTTYYPLHYSVKLGYLNIINFLITKVGFDQEAIDNKGRYPLHIACEYSGNVDLVRYLIEVAGCNINAKTPNGSTPLFPKCDRKAADKYGRQALHVACAVSGNVELVKYLIEKGRCDINATRLDGNTSLHIACEKNEIAIVQFLTSQSECNRECINNDGQRPLHIACESADNLDLVKCLVEDARCDINTKDRFGNAPLLIVCKKKFLRLAKYFTNRSECQSVSLTMPTSLDPKSRELLDNHSKYQQALNNEQITYLRNVKCILTGPPGAGKSTLKKRLLNETVTIHSPSTGVVDAGIQIQLTFRKLQQECVIVPGLEENINWRQQSVDEEAFSVYDRLSRTSSSKSNTDIGTASEDILISDKPIEQECEYIHSNTFEIDKANYQIEINSNISSPMVLNSDNEDVNKNEDNITDDGDTDSRDSDMTEIINLDATTKHSDQGTPSKVKAVRTLLKTVQSISLTERAEYEQRLQESCEGGHATLNIIDTGGQPEFHEVLPALITGPAINLLTFKLTEPLQELLKITYRSPSGETQPYETSFTHEEVIFRSLASIACLRENTIGWKFDKLPMRDDSEPAAFLITTHRDCVENTKIAEVNEQLKMKIENSVDLFHDNLVQFSNKHQVIFPVDTINDQTEIEDLRNLLCSVMSHKFKKLPIPVSWYTFSVKLRKSERPIHKLDTCIKLAQDCGISDVNHIKSALWFLHHRVGCIMHYPEVEGLDDIVITDIQLVFDRITELITSSFTFATTNNAAIDKEFHTTGRFTELHLINLSSKKRDPLTPVRLVSLLKHLHIVAGPMKSKVGHKTEKYYFMPCALKPTTIEEEYTDQSTCPAPLLIHFKCGYNPVGVFCCLVVHLLSTTSQYELKWTLSKLDQYRNKITFTVGKCCDQITLISRATYLEIWIDRKPDISNAMSLKSLCPNIYNVIDHGIKTVTESLHYTYKSCHLFGFPCTGCKFSTPHPAICEYEDPVVAECVYGTNVLPLQEQHTIWFDKGISKKQDKDEHDYSSLSSDSRYNQMSVPLDPIVARRALVHCTDIIAESKIESSDLARKLYSVEVISEDVYTRVRDKQCRDSNKERLEKILDEIKDRVQHNSSILITFIKTLNALNRNDLADVIERKYKELESSTQNENVMEGKALQKEPTGKEDTYNKVEFEGPSKGLQEKNLDVNMSVSSKNHSRLLDKQKNRRKKKHKLGDKRERVKNNESDMSDTDYLSRKCSVSKRHKSSATTMPNDEFIGYGKEPANKRSYLRKGMRYEDKSSLHTKRKKKQKDTRDKKLKTEDSCSSSDQGTLSSESD